MRKHLVISSLFALVLTSCGSSSSSTISTAEEPLLDAPASTVDSPTDAVTNADGSVNIDVKVGIDDYDTLAGNRVVKVALGTAVTITLTDANEDQDYHLHIYDVGAEAKMGQPGVISLVVDQAGQFDVESHTTGKTLLVLVVG